MPKKSSVYKDIYWVKLNNILSYNLIKKKL